MEFSEIAALRRDAFRSRDVDLARVRQIIGAPAVPGGRGSRSTSFDTSTKVLLKIGDARESRRIEAAIRSLPGPRRATSDPATVAAGLRVETLGRPRRDGSQWLVVDLRISLGAFLERLEYSKGRLKEFTKDLRGISGVVAAEVDLPSPNLVWPLQESIPGCTAGRDSASTEVSWAPRLVGLFDLPPGSPAGTGILIGHIDSGYTDHAELDVGTAYDLDSATSTIDDGDGEDPMPGGSSHGTATGTVLTSAHGTTATNDLGQPSDGITGLVPRATIVAARALDSVVVAEPIFTQSAIAAAVNHCIDQQCDVISMSFGGIVSLAVVEALAEAAELGIVLCAAAGNCVEFVVQPATLDYVIACGGVGIDAAGSVHPWPGTSHGPAVDISAPAENVWVGDWIDNSPVVRPGEGTSFAAPHVAGAAAMWLEHHGGRSALQEAYEGTGRNVVDVFREVVRRSATVPSGWDTSEYGAGIVNLPGLLEEPLPPAATVAPSSGGFPSIPDLEELAGIVGGGLLPIGGLDLIPVLAEPVTVVVDFQRLVVRDDGEFWGGAEPYLLLTLLVVDGTTAEIEVELNLEDLNDSGAELLISMSPLPGRESIVRTVQRGTHGNLEPVNIGPFELAADGPTRVDIPNSLGVFRTDIQPIPVRLLVDSGDVGSFIDITGLPGFVGVLALLAEEDFTPTDAIEAAHDAVTAGVRGILEDVLGVLDISDLSVDPSSFVERSAEIQDEAAAAAADEMNLWELFWGGVVDPDDNLLQVLKFVNVLQLGTPLPMEDRYQDEHGDWILVGEIRLEDEG